MSVWIFITVLTAAAAAEFILSLSALKRYSVVIPVTGNFCPDRRMLSEIYQKIIAENRRALMILYIDGASDEIIKICRDFSRKNSRAVVYFADIM